MFGLFVVIHPQSSKGVEPVASDAAQSLVARDGWVYWTKHPQEFCEGPTCGAIKKVRGGGILGGESINGYFIYTAGSEEVVPDMLEIDSQINPAWLYFWTGTEIRRRWVGGGFTTPWLADTNGTVDAVAVDDAYVYWADDDGIKRVPKNGGETVTIVPGAAVNQHALAVEAPAAFDVDVEPIMIWAEGVAAGTGVLKYRSKAPVDRPTFTIQNGLDNPRFLVMDDEFIYWAEVDARVSRSSKTGGAIETISDGEAAYTVTGIDVDESYLFWGEGANFSTGRIRRWAKGESGGAADLIVGDLQGRPAVSLDGEHVYFSGGPQLACDGDPDGPSCFTDADCGVGGSCESIDPDCPTCNVMRESKHAEPLRVNLKWNGFMEITQGIQDTSDPPGVRLSSTKPTLVRAFPTAEGASQAGVVAVLHGNPGPDPGDGFPDSPLPATDVFGTPVFRGAGVDRETLWRSINFILPKEWQEVGEITLCAEINPDGTILEASEEDDADDDLCQTVTFESMYPICVYVTPVWVDLDSDGVVDDLFDMLSTGFWDIIDRLQTLFPTEIRVFQFLNTPITESGGPFEGDEEGTINDALERYFWFDSAPAFPTPQCQDWLVHTAGLLNGDINPDWGGLGNTSGPKVLWAEMRTPDIDDPGFENPGSGGLFAHELAHNYGREHIDCSSATKDPADPDADYPHCVCQFGPGGGTCTEGDGTVQNDCGDTATLFGYDEIGADVISPTEAGDLMGYCSPRWVSDYTWEALMDQAAAGEGAELSAAAETAESLSGGTSEFLFVFGTVSLAQPPTATIIQAYRVPPGMFSPSHIARLMAVQQEYTPPNGSYALMLVRSNNTMISAQPFEPPAGSHPQTELGFALLVPFDAATAKVRVVDGPTVIGERIVSANPPSIALITPTPGELVNDFLVIRWNSFDGDGDALSHVVQYSHDYGTTWVTLSHDHPTVPHYCNSTGAPCMSNLDCGGAAPVCNLGGTVFIVDDLRLLRGSTGTTGHCLPNPTNPSPSSRVRVIVSDGVHTAVATSEPFTVPCKPPVAHIEAPRDGFVFLHSDQIKLRGRGVDPEEGILPPERLIWTVLPGGMVGSGNALSLPGLPPGTYDVGLVVVDQDGMTGSDQVRIEVATCREIPDAFDVGAAMIQEPNLDELWDSDVHPSSFGPQIVADNVSFSQATAISALRWWGGYSYDVGAPDLDNFTLRIMADANGVPDLARSWERHLGNHAARRATGQLISSVDGDIPEHAYEAALCEPFEAEAGRPYWISIVNDTSAHPTTWSWETGGNGDNEFAVTFDGGMTWFSVPGSDVSFELLEAPCLPSLPNDTCYNPAAMMTLEDGLNSHDNRCATSDGPGDDRCYANVPFSLHDEVWYQYVATCTGQLTVSMCPADGGQVSPGYDAYIVIYGDGNPTCSCPLDFSSELICGDDSCGQSGRGPSLNIPVTQGNCYTVAVGGADDGTGLGFSRGTGVIHVDCSPCAGHNVALGRPATASQSLPESPPESAFDGVLPGSPFYQWNSGDFAPQWIEVDLGASYTVGRIRLVVSQSPDGDTQHLVMGKGPTPGEPYQLLHEFSGFTTDGQILEHVSASAWNDLRFVRVETTASPSWVSWQEIEVYCGTVETVTPPLPGDDTCQTAGADTGVPCTTNAACSSPATCGNKGRYVSITPVNVALGSSSIQVEIVSMPQFPSMVGDIYYAGVEGSIPNSPNPALRGAALQCTTTPHSQTWTTGVLHLFGQAIVPGSIYNVRMCDAGGGDCSVPLLVATAKWGDVIRPFTGGSQPNFGDVNAIVQKFGNLVSAPSMPRADLVGPGNPGVPNPPNQAANFADISADVSAFSGFAYPYAVTVCPP